jgi:hypothetical protein
MSRAAAFEAPAAHGTHPYLAANPGARSSDRITGTVVLVATSLEVVRDVLGTGRSPQGEKVMVGIRERAAAPHGGQASKVVARVKMHGRHLGECLGRAPTGKEYAVEHIHIWRRQDGEVIEHWSVRDDLGQALRLGLIGG